MQWQNFLGYKYLVASGLSRSSLSLVVLRCHADVTLSLIHKARKKKKEKKLFDGEQSINEKHRTRGRFSTLDARDNQNYQFAIWRSVKRTL
jgi:hypothetical protein